MSGQRKKDHIELAFQSQVMNGELDQRFYYEPLLSGHPSGDLPKLDFLGKQMHAPIWISSMTGGTELAAKINQNLARACAEFGLGMGLGSCRPLLESNERFQDFNLRPIIGNDLPFYANLGIAQIEDLLSKNQSPKISELIKKLQADGLIVHVNPLQEWLQPEGDRFQKAPIDTIQELLEKTDFPIIVKEVGQGMGYNSLKALMQLPLAAIDFAASGGTNFSKLELLRANKTKQKEFEAWTKIGHTAEEMCLMVNKINRELGSAVLCKEVIVSGGVKNFLDGYYLINSITSKAIYGQGAAFLNHAREDYESLSNFVKNQIEGLKLANAYLRLRNDKSKG